MALPKTGELAPLTHLANPAISLDDHALAKELLLWAEHIRGLKKRTDAAHQIMLALAAASWRLDPPPTFVPGLGPVERKR